MKAIRLLIHEAQLRLDFELATQAQGELAQLDNCLKQFITATNRASRLAALEKAKILRAQLGLVLSKKEVVV